MSALARQRAYRTTTADLAAALIGTQRAKQSVRVVSQTHGGGFFRAIVLVVPYGQETGTYYEINHQRTLDQLNFGRTPEWLQLEPFEATEADEDEFERSFGLKAHTRAMERAGAFRR